MWKPVLNGTYEVSNLGRVRSAKTLKIRKLKETVRPNGTYYSVNLSVGGKVYWRRINRLVCEAFHGPPPDPTWHADHIDRDPSNNRAENLRWLTAQENLANRKLPDSSGENHSHNKLTECEVHKIRRLLRDTDLPQQEIGRMFGVGGSTISAILRGRIWGVDPIKRAAKVAKGETHSKSKLKRKDVIAIKQLLAEGVPQREIARRFEISRSNVQSIHYGRSWKDVSI